MFANSDNDYLLTYLEFAPAHSHYGNFTKLCLLIKSFNDVTMNRINNVLASTYPI